MLLTLIYDSFGLVTKSIKFIYDIFVLATADLILKYDIRKAFAFDFNLGTFIGSKQIDFEEMTA